MGTQLLFGDRDYRQGILKNYKFTIFADLAAANVAVGSIYGFAYLVVPGSLYYNQNGIAWQPVGGKGIKGDTGNAGPTGPVGPIGLTGPAGPKGSVWYTGAGAPGTLHVNGDYYLNSTNGDVYEQIAGVWTLVANIKGPIGNTGPAGTPGTPGAPGATGPVGPSGPAGIGGSYWYADFDAPATHTQTSAVNPVAAPAVGVYYHFNSATSTFWLWNATSLTWAMLPFGYYVNTADSGLWVMSSGGWSYVTNLASSPIAPPIVTANKTLTRDGATTIVAIDSTAGPLTLTLFVPQQGDKVFIKDISGQAAANPVTVAIPSGAKLDAVTNGTAVIDTAFGELDLIFATYNTFPVTTPATSWWKQNLLFGIGKISAVTAATTLTRRNSQVVQLDSTGSAFTLTLPVSPLDEDIIHIHDSSGQAELNVVTLAAAAGFDSAVPVVDAKYMSLTLVFRGGTWRTMADSRLIESASTTLSANTTLTAKRTQTVLYNVSGGAFAITLPASPRERDVVRLKEKTGSTNVLTVTGTVDGVVNPTYSVAYEKVLLEYLSSAWRRM